MAMNTLSPWVGTRLKGPRCWYCIERPTCPAFEAGTGATMPIGTANPGGGERESGT